MSGMDETAAQRADKLADELAFEIGARLAVGHDPNAIAAHLIASGWQRASSRTAPLGVVAIIAFVVGGVASLLLWDWRWAVIGVGLLLVCAAIGSGMERSRG